MTRTLDLTARFAVTRDVYYNDSTKMMDLATARREGLYIGSPYCQVKISDQQQKQYGADIQWACNREKGHPGPHIATGDGYITAIWDSLPPLKFTDQERFEYAFNAEYNQLPPVVGGWTLANSQVCGVASPNMGWPCTKKKDHGAKHISRGPSPTTSDRYYAIWEKES